MQSSLLVSNLVIVLPDVLEDGHIRIALLNVLSFWWVPQHSVTDGASVCIRESISGTGV